MEDVTIQVTKKDNNYEVGDHVVVLIDDTFIEGKIFSVNSGGKFVVMIKNDGGNGVIFIAVSLSDLVIKLKDKEFLDEAFERRAMVDIRIVNDGE